MMISKRLRQITSTLRCLSATSKQISMISIWSRRKTKFNNSNSSFNYILINSSLISILHSFSLSLSSAFIITVYIYLCTNLLKWNQGTLKKMACPSTMGMVENGEDDDEVIHVLAVDDNPVNLIILEKLLKSFSCKGIYVCIHILNS